MLRLRLGFCMLFCGLALVCVGCSSQTALVKKPASALALQVPFEGTPSWRRMKALEADFYRPITQNAALELTALPSIFGIASPFRIRSFFYHNRRIGVWVHNVSDRAQVFRTGGLYFYPNRRVARYPQRMGTMGVFDVVRGGVLTHEYVKWTIPPKGWSKILLWVACFDPQRPSPPDYHEYILAPKRLPASILKEVSSGVRHIVTMEGQALAQKQARREAALKEALVLRASLQKNVYKQNTRERQERIARQRRERAFRAKMKKIEEVVVLARCGKEWLTLVGERPSDRSQAAFFLKDFLQRVTLTAPHLLGLSAEHRKKMKQAVRVFQGVYGVFQQIKQIHKDQRRRHRHRR